jgi:hypothetical protein
MITGKNTIRKVVPMVVMALVFIACLKCDITTGTKEPFSSGLDMDNSLKSLVISGDGSWDRSFSPQVLNYTYTIKNTIDSIKVTPDANSRKSQITVNGKDCPNGKVSEPIPLSVGNNNLTISVMSEAGSILQYIITVVRSNATESDDLHNAMLSKLSVGNAGTLEPSFSQTITEYSITVTDTTIVLQATAVMSEKGAVVTFTLQDGEKIDPSNLELKTGLNTIIITVTAPDGVTKKAYSLKITRLSVKDDDAVLTSLIISGVTLTPIFNPDTLKYAASVPETKIPLDINAATRSAKASIKISLDGTPVTNQHAINITNQTTSLVLEVTSADSSTKRNYTIVITKAQIPDNDAGLASFEIAGVSLTPGFNPDTLHYTTSVPEIKIPLDVNAATRSTKASIKISLDGTPVTNQHSINITDQTASLGAEVTAADGFTKRYYTVAITKVNNPPNANANLSGVEITFGTKNSKRPLYHTFNEPTKTAFDPAIMKYASVVYACSSITVKVTAEDPAVNSIIFNNDGDGNTTAGIKIKSIPLSAGAGKVTPVTVKVTGKDESTIKTYTIDVKLLNIDECYWGIYKPLMDRSADRWDATVPNPGPGLNQTIKGFVSGTLDWTVTVVGFRGKNKMVLTNYCDGNDDQGSTRIYTPYDDNCGENTQDGFVVNGTTIGDVSISGSGIQAGEYIASTPWGDRIASDSVNFVITSKKKVEDPNSYVKFTYMGVTKKFMYVDKTSAGGNYPYPFKDGYDWYTPWDDGK